MAIYTNKNKSHVGQFLNSDWTELPANAEYKASVEAAAVPPVVTSYPTTNPTKVGQKFIYKGNEWKYHSQAEIDDLGWNGIVSEGFPAPVSKFFNLHVLYNGDFVVPDIVPGYIQGYRNPWDNTGLSLKVEQSISGEIDVLGFGASVTKAPYVEILSLNLSKVRNFNFLINLRNYGTGPAINIRNNKFTAEGLNDMFTQLPPTTNSATIDIAINPGSATCDPSIATAKGYIVVT